jgi:photosystem II stability/assembly factor-like uncharacterized protein
MRSLALFLSIVATLSVDAQWLKQSVNTTASFRGLSVVNDKVVWASGTGGTVIRTIDGGKNWSVMAVDATDKLDFRDIEAFDANTAYILSIGNGDTSRIYKTLDGGKTWKLQFKNTNEKAFFDAIACWDKNNCIAMSDPVDGKYLLIKTTDGGGSWIPADTSQMPATKDGEAAFAASGTCLYVNPKNGDVFLISGGTDARVFRSSDRGKTWNVSETPVIKGTAGSGIFSIAMRDAKNGIIVGGNYETPNEIKGTAAVTSDGGRTWQALSGLTGYRSGVAFNGKTTLAVGTNGADVSTDGGLHWVKGSDYNLNAVAAGPGKYLWAVGPNGAVYSIRK